MVECAIFHLSALQVALLAEGVDRNYEGLTTVDQLIVALLAEGVDRNSDFGKSPATRTRSPSSRRAWIEISTLPILPGRRSVALLAEGVDRNFLPSHWPHPSFVALLAEGVDRNHDFLHVRTCELLRRPPRGGRG